MQYLLERYDELVALVVRGDPQRRARLNAQGRLILAIDGLQPDVGHEILWLIRDVVSGEVLLARSLLSACQSDLATLLREAIAGLEAPVVGSSAMASRALPRPWPRSFPGCRISCVSITISSRRRHRRGRPIAMRRKT